ncbi:hypothetical protein C1752_10484 [Acaryochloris thomasi RCC1774]|uniref:Uncharacterized protein n=1 Tax=Acaryochloris thomasi RCC1774 TaxID=1764569 RepID=A0A2W1JK82_9CYAN|nr:hypothetical protein [Acaryochloris thomasi]PZD70634.1 hypothetical protein C1752_10484 [Acaryochloris thomasi RCC1774]
MPNPKGNTESLKHFARGDDSKEPLADQPVQVRLPVSLDAKVRALQNRTAWMRKVLIEAAEREGLI